MPKEFYLNECLPEHPTNGTDVVTLFRDMVKEYMNMRKNPLLDLAQCWVTNDNVDKVYLCGITLKNLLGQLKTDRVVYPYAIRLLCDGLPIVYKVEDLAGDEELGLDFQCNGRDAHNLLAAQKLNMITASLPVEAALCNDQLELVYSDRVTGTQTAKHVHNWYIDNSATIIRLLTPQLPANSQPWDKLMALLGQHGKVVCSKLFEGEWNKLGIGTQQLIVSRFEDALNGGLLFPSNNNNMNIVKRDQWDKTSNVHELRQKGRGFRIYFECDVNAIYIALYGSKTVHYGKDQESDFRVAKTVVERMRKGIL